MLRRFALNTLLILALIMALAAVAAPFMSELCAKESAKLNAAYAWRDADERIELAMQLDPFRAAWHRVAARLYMKRAGILKDNRPMLLKAERAYGEARRLNPQAYKYRMEGATLMAGLFAADPEAFGDRLPASVAEFRAVYAGDPNNYVFDYHSGMTLLPLWAELGEGDKSFTIELLRRSMELMPWYHWHVYPELWAISGDFERMLDVTPPRLDYYLGLYSFVRGAGLWEHRRAVLDLIERHRESEEPHIIEAERMAVSERISLIKAEYVRAAGPAALAGTPGGPASLSDWSGTADNGRNEYEDGAMYWAGTVERLIHLPAGTAGITVAARATPASGVYPYMAVELDGDEIGATYVESGDWKDYAFTVTGEGLRLLSVTYLNDGGRSKKGEDRNLYVGEVRSR